MASTSSAAAVIVVGAGSVGANVAYRLAREGARVTVLDAAAPGTGASGASFAWTNSFGKPPREYHDLNVAGMAEHERLAEELGGRWFHRSGNLEWAETDAARARLQQSVDRLREWDYPVETIGIADAAALEPDLRFAPGVTDAVYAPRDGWVEVVPMVAALLAAATRAGARVESGQRVTGFVREGDTIRGVLTAAGGRFEGDLVVDCAGHAAGELVGLAGASLPVDGEPGRLIYTSPVATTLSRPIHAPGVHFRPDGAGRIVLAEQAHDQVVGQEPPGSPADPGQWTPERSLEAAARHLPALAAARVEATRIGVRPMPRDRLPIVGAVPERPGLYVVVSHSGITLGPLWGRVAAGEILGRRPDPRLASFRATRFA
jgi:glycine/D-amino acid oxidase-like deaminating enzyme